MYSASIAPVPSMVSVPLVSSNCQVTYSPQVPCVLDEILHQRAVNCITDCLLADAMKAAQSGATVREIINIQLVKQG